MPNQSPLFEDSTSLSEKLAEILLTGSLYRPFVYRGKACHTQYTTSHGGHQRIGYLPKQIFRYCDHEECKTQTKWETEKEKVYFTSEFIENVATRAETVARRLSTTCLSGRSNRK
jgi:hypothetical protein